MISTKGRYAVRVLIDMAERTGDDPIPLRYVAQRQGVSEKYLQRIAKQLVDAGIVRGVSGKGGGYVLSRSADEITVYEVLEAAEGTLASVSCLVVGAQPCDRASHCKTLPLWKGFDETVRNFFEGVTIGELARGQSF